MTAKPHTEEQIKETQVAYFSMEVGINPSIPTYSGGLGVLAGDMLRSCADLSVPLVAVTLLNEQGYFFQQIDENGNQIELPFKWRKDDFLKPVDVKVSVIIAGRTVKITAWEYLIEGETGSTVPIYFIYTNLPENSPEDQGLTGHLYGGDSRYRLSQEIILGIGGVRVLNALGYRNIRKYHMNEGHAALLVLELMKEEKQGRTITNKKFKNIDDVRKRCAFTTHTPVPAGHDKFPKDLVKELLGDFLSDEECNKLCPGDELNLTRLALEHSEHINGVAKKHGEISRNMFPGYAIDSITNGVHAVFWAAEPFRLLFDKYIPGWRNDPYSLRNALMISREEIVEAHRQAKKELIDYVNRENNAGLDYDVLTFGFARRAARYKRAELIFSDIPRLKKIAENAGALQIIYAGKAHPNDGGGKDIIRRIHEKLKAVKPEINGAYLSNYDINIGKLLTSGVDVWVNTPARPLEASGTSGMKAATNGVPSFSVLDGWWIEGYLKNVTGWRIGPKPKPGEDTQSNDEVDAEDLYTRLENIILPMYYNNQYEWTKIMRHAIAINASFFNSHRMVQQYVTSAYFD
ncbi:MAG: alpha-glucan family phosphorylase [Candidatus Altiarchaeota archaeon]